MLAAWPHVTGNRVVLRPSMVKFESPHLKLGAMKASCSFVSLPSPFFEADRTSFLSQMAKFSPAHLNRQVIMIMDSMGVDKVSE